MLFLAWLAVSFLAVAAINLYLRYFGLPRRAGLTAGGGAAVSADGRSYSYVTSTGAAGAAAGGGYFQGFHAAGHGSIPAGESVRWINGVLSWVYQRTQTGGARPEIVESWLRALTEEAEKQSRDVQLRFDGVHGSVPELSNFSVDVNTAPSVTSDSLTMYAAVSAKDITLSMSAINHTAMPTRTIYCDVYILHLQGQLKIVSKPSNNELPMFVSFISSPEMRLQVLPSGRLDSSMDITTIEKLVRAVVSGAVTPITWSSRATSLRGGATFTDQLHATQQPFGATSGGAMSNQPFRQISDTSPVNSSQQNFSGQNVSGAVGTPPYRVSDQLQLTPTLPHNRQQQQPLTQLQQPQLQQQQHSLQLQQQQQQLQPQQYQLQQQHQQLQQQQPFSQQQQLSQQQQQQQQHQPLQHQQPFQQQQSLQQQQQHQSLQQQQQQQPQHYNSYDTQHAVDAFQNAFNASVATNKVNRLLVKVIKANGLADNDLGGSCNAYCLVHIDQPAQSFMTTVIRNTVNPMWDEQFVFEVDGATRQVQFEVLDRDKQPDGNLLGRTTVSIDEIRRMQSSRQILPLTGRPRSRTATSGSVTVEFVFLDATEVAAMMGAEQQIRPVNASSSLQATPNLRYNDNTPRSDLTAGGYGSYQGQGQVQGQGRLSAHDLALNPSLQQQQGLNRAYESPTLVVTGAEAHRANMQGATLDMQGNLDTNRGREKKESFASALRKRLSRGGGKKRSQSADRAYSQSVREGTLLKPPGGEPSTGNFDISVEYSINEQKVRSNSFGSSIKRIFKPTKSKNEMMRASSLTRPSPTPQELNQQQSMMSAGTLSPYGTQQQQMQMQQQQQLQQQQQQGTLNRSRQTTPVPPLRGQGLNTGMQYNSR